MSDNVLAASDDAAPEVVAEAQAEADEQTKGNPEAVDAPEAETDDTDAAKVEEKSAAKKRRERRQAELAALREREANARASLERIKTAAQGEVEPKRDEFDDPDEYVAAKAAWRGAQSVAKREEAAAQEALNQVARQREAEAKAMWMEQVSEARTRYEDFDRVALDPAVPITPQIASMLQQSDAGADVAYYLGQNRAEAHRIATLPPLEAARELGRIEATMALPKPKTQQSVPPPVRPVTGRGQPQRDPSKMSYAEYRKWRSGQAT